MQHRHGEFSELSQSVVCHIATWIFWACEVTVLDQ